jgi:hypothetical protein
MRIHRSLRIHRRQMRRRSPSRRSPPNRFRRLRLFPYQLIPPPCRQTRPILLKLRFQAMPRLQLLPVETSRLLRWAESYHPPPLAVALAVLPLAESVPPRQDLPQHLLRRPLLMPPSLAWVRAP